MAVPKNWPSTLPYLTSPSHSKHLSPSQVQALRTKPPSTSTGPSIRPSTPSTVPAAYTQTPSGNVRIQTIQTPSHPASGQRGLFATRDLKPGAFILPYLGRVHSSGPADTDPQSDYDLWLDKEAGVAVDAARQGNEGRFVNDYRGVADRPNAEFGTVWCEKWAQLCVGFWVVGRPGKKGRVEGVRKGEEILVSYGKGFWGERPS
ncbi:SET protein [Geosmithia morbida]|uniref:SET protein n=1 Tax=Geosmithia morbida TaxID=1094350 RepID=A0A9P5D5P0_9HYPO|nr:SET protein [Geosmithia morbida]KAF4122689.1 SET protein [Geosmithia morbida]